MNLENIEIYRPRSISGLGVWEIHNLRFKIYGIYSDGQELSESLVCDAETFARVEVPPLVELEGDDNGLGFVIIHAGDLGVSVLVHWWIQGSVLCQHIKRTLWDSDHPMDTTTRPVIACVWELGLINAEQTIWRKTMMTDKPDPEAYLNLRPAMNET